MRWDAARRSPEPPLPKRQRQESSCFGQDAAETAAGADEGDGGTGQIGHCGGSFMIVTWNNHPPAKPEVFQLPPPQRALFAIDENENSWISEESRENYRPTTIGNLSGVAAILRRLAGTTPGDVKRLLPPRQSQGISLMV